MLRLKNNTKSVSKIGYLVSVDPSDPSSFVYTTPNSTKALGVVTESVDYRKLCSIATLGDTVRVHVTGNVNKGDIIRNTKSNDRISLGACAIAKLGDAPYLRIGTALQSGQGLIECALDLTYISGITDSIGLGAVADGAYTVGLGGATNGIITIQNGIIIAIQEAT